jgi:uncharacterized protein (TIGR00730 family)
VKSLCVYCGSCVGLSPAYAQAAVQCGSVLAARGITLVYGGGNIGLMGIMADAALAAGGKVIGVIPQALVKRELAHRGLTELHTVRTMHERKQKMADLSDAFLALPGGVGTMDEFFEILTWLQLGIHSKPVGLLNTTGFYAGLLDFMNHMRKEQFLRNGQLDRLVVEDRLELLLDKMAAFDSGSARPFAARA